CQYHLHERMDQRSSLTHPLTRVVLTALHAIEKKGVEALASTPWQSPRHEDSILSVTHRGTHLRNRSEMPEQSTADTCNDHPSASCNPSACLNSASDCSGRGVDLLDQPSGLRYNPRSKQSVATRTSHLDFRNRPSYVRDGCNRFGCYSSHSGGCSRDSGCWHDSYHIVLTS